MSVIGKLYNKLPLKKHSQTDPAKEPVLAYKDKFIPKLANYLPWSHYVKRYMVIDEETKIEMCIVIQKNGSIQQTYAFRGVDIESCSPEYVVSIFENFNNQIKRLGDGWMVSIESQRFRMSEYPASDFESVAGLLVDKERQEEFRDSGEHFDSSYFLTFVYKPEREIKQKIIKLFYKEPEEELLISQEIKTFIRMVQNITGVLLGRIVIRPLDCEETVCFLHSTCSDTKQNFILPEDGQFLFLDRFISDCKMDIGRICRLGDNYIPIIEINDFPVRTYPAIFNNLNRLDIEYRWVSRYFPLDKEQAEKELVDYQQQGASKKTSSAQMVDEMAFGASNGLENHSGTIAQSEAEMAQEEVGGDINGLGYYNSCIMVWDKDYKRSLEKARDVIKVVQQTGFGAKLEEIGSFDAFLGMMAGNVTADVRRPLVTTGNFTHTLPFSAIWAGMEYNRFMNEVCGCDKPLITCSTNFGANYYLNLNDGDVGHTLILGPTGAGKSTLLNLIAVSALKYPGIQIFFMDYGLSSLTLTLAVGGTYINPSDSDVCFQPLADVDKPEDFAWAIEYIITLIEMQGIEVDATMKVAITAAMKAVSIQPLEMRTLTTFCLNLQYEDKNHHRVLHDALEQYTIKGRYGKIFDGDRTTLGKDRWVLFEMEQIMNMGSDCSGPALLFIFHFLEKSFTGRLTFFIMDECWFGLENPAIQSKMKEYLLTLRKKNVFCIFATQNPHAVASSPLSSVMIQNCPTHIFLADPKAREKSLKEDYKALGLTDEEVGILADSTKKMDYYIKCTQGTRKFQLSLGELQLALFRNKESKYRLASGAIVSWYDVLKILMKERNQENGKIRAMVDKILDLQGIKFRHYLEGMRWQEWL